MVYEDRVQAGRALGEALAKFAGEDVVVLGLPRGGVPVAAEVALALGAPLDVILVRKLGVPFQPELAMGAIGEDGVRVLNEDVMRMAQVSSRELERVEAVQREELERRSVRFREGRDRVDVAGRTVLVVDDGVATGSTARAACRVARAHGARRVVLATPVAPPEVHERFAHDADEVVALSTPSPFYAVGEFYRDFTQVSDDEVVRILRGAAAAADDPPAPATAARHEEVEIPVAGVVLQGHLDVPPAAVGVVAFAHGSGSSRHSPRNRYVASVLQEAGIATLLFDLLTAAEELDRANVFDVELLARRLSGAATWLRSRPGLADLPLGYFGASTGAAAALWAAAEPGARVAAVVSRGGRPDLAHARLPAVQAPVLLVVGGEDDVVLRLNELAADRMRCERRVTVVPGATHLFEEPGRLEAAAGAARDWFLRWFVADR